MARILLPSPGVTGQALGAPGAEGEHCSSPERLSVEKKNMQDSGSRVWISSATHIPTHLDGRLTCRAHLEIQPGAGQIQEVADESRRQALRQEHHRPQGRHQQRTHQAVGFEASL